MCIEFHKNSNNNIKQSKRQRTEVCGKIREIFYTDFVSPLVTQEIDFASRAGDNEASDNEGSIDVKPHLSPTRFGENVVEKAS